MRFRRKRSRALHWEACLRNLCQRSQDELLRNRCPPKTVDVWRKGVDTNMFHPRHRSQVMRERLSGGSPAAPILVYVGRLGAGAVRKGFVLVQGSSSHTGEGMAGVTGTGDVQVQGMAEIGDVHGFLQCVESVHKSHVVVSPRNPLRPFPSPLEPAPAVPFLSNPEGESEPHVDPAINLTPARMTPSIAAVRAEKNLYVLRDVLERIPQARLAFVGDGPEREALEKHFAGTKTVFTV